MSFLGGTDNERSIRVGVFTFLFIFFYSIGQGPGILIHLSLVSISDSFAVAFAYASEVFPLFNREAGMSWAVFVNLFSAGMWIDGKQLNGCRLRRADSFSRRPSDSFRTAGSSRPGRLAKSASYIARVIRRPLYIFFSSHLLARP